ncbi:hypothetical protein [Vallicoccus soli]|nr:hypothetical protein [Vallicoccus soli]
MTKPVVAYALLGAAFGAFAGSFIDVFEGEGSRVDWFVVALYPVLLLTGVLAGLLKYRANKRKRRRGEGS